MTKNELINVVGGASNITSATFLNAISRLVGTLLSFGQTVGSAINYYLNGKRC